MLPLPLLRRNALLALALLGLGGAAHAQQADVRDDCGPLQGTIPVADAALDRAALARVTESQATDAALGAVSGATVRDVDLEEEDGFLVYEVDLLQDGQEYEAYVDAGSGAVLCVERED